MSMTPRAEQLLAEFATESGDYTLVGLLLNPVTGEVGVFASHDMPVGQALGVMSQAVQLLLSAASDGTLEAVNATNEGREESAKAALGSLAAINGGPYVH